MIIKNSIFCLDHINRRVALLFLYGFFSTEISSARNTTDARMIGVSQKYYDTIIEPVKNKTTLSGRFLESSHSGTYREIGRSEAIYLLKIYPDFKKEFIENKLFVTVTNPPDVKEIKDQFQKYFPQILEEMSGFAEIMKMDPDTVLRYFSLQGYKIGGGCTVFVVGKEKTKNGHLLIGRNHDFIQTLTDLAVVHIRPKDAFSSVGSSEVVFGRLDGINEHGVFTAMASSFSKKTYRTGFFQTIIQRAILDKARNIEEAISIVEKMPISIGYNFVVADPTGKAAVIEKVPGTAVSIRWLSNSKSGFLVTTNHFQNNKTRNMNSFVFPHSYERDRKTKRLLDKAKISFKDIFNILTSSGKDGVYLKDFEYLYGTIFSSVYDLNESSWNLKVGNVQKEYKLKNITHPTMLQNSTTEVLFESAPPDVLDYASLSPLGLIDINSLYWSSRTFLMSGPVAGLGTEIGINYKLGLFGTEKTYGPNLKSGVYFFASPAYLQTGLDFTLAPTPFIEFNVRPFYYYGWNLVKLNESSHNNASIIQNKLEIRNVISLGTPAISAEITIRLFNFISFSNKISVFNFNERIYDFEFGILIKDKPVYSPSLLVIIPFNRNFLWGFRTSANFEFGLNTLNLNIGPILVFPKLIGPFSLSINPVYWIFNPEGDFNFSINIALMGAF